MTFIISEKLNYQFVFPSPPFSKLYMHYTYIILTQLSVVPVLIKRKIVKCAETFPTI